MTHDQLIAEAERLTGKSYRMQAVHAGGFWYNAFAAALKQEDHGADFVECPACRSKPGTPVLCDSCLHNRAVISRLTEQRDAAIAERDHERRERDALQKAHDLLNKGYESACELMDGLKQENRNLKVERDVLLEDQLPAKRTAREKAEAQQRADHRWGAGILGTGQ